MKNKKIENKTSKIWDNYYKSFDKKNLWTGNQYPNEALVRFVSNLRKNNNKIDYFKDHGKGFSIKNNFSGEALEIGFGGLANLLMLNNKGFNCTGIEVSENSVLKTTKYLKNKKLKNIKTIHVNDMSKMPFPNQKFDLIVGLQCIYYNLDMDKVINEVERLLTKRGKFIFSFFSNKHEYMKYIDYVDKKKNIIKWSKKHPNKRIVGSKLIFIKNIKSLKKKFKIFKNVNIFTYEFDQLPLFQSWWYITGEKK